MSMSLQWIKGATTVVLVAVIAAYGASILLGARIETVREEEGTRRVDSRQTTAVPSGRLAGAVRDDEGRPVAGATVVAGQFRGGKPNHRIGTTRTDGRFELAPAGESVLLDYVLAHKDGFAPAGFLRGPRDDRDGEGDVVFRLTKPVPFVGAVRDRDGKQVAGATARIEYAQYPGSDGPDTRLNVIEPIVRGTPLERLFRSTTDAQGRFLFPAMPRGAKASLVITAMGMGEYNFTGLAEGTANIFLTDHSNDGPWTYRAAADTVLRPGRMTEITIELIRGAQVEGRVIDARNGNPVAEVGVGVYGPMRPPGGAAIISAKTDNEGRYRFRLPPGQTTFYICGPVPAGYDGGLNGGHTVDVPAGTREFTVPAIEIRPSSLEQ